MRILSLLFIFVVIVSCGVNKSANNNRLAFIITNSIIKDSTIVSLEIINPTNKDYYLPIDFYGRNNFEFFGVNRLTLLYPTIILKENGREVLFTFSGSTGSYTFGTNVKKNLYLNQFSNIKRITKVKAKSKAVVNFPFYVKNKSLYSSNYESYEVEEDKMYDFEIRYQADKDVVKTVLNKSTLDSLQAMGYELYDKEIISNKVPFRVK
ncbi:hypothetical protein [Flavobacterium sp. '19STA2R22 D10 B1']|uniref:hypothetical protein n=1 Tax=Flavobacterium aerium TaxID=3037261 RepID=UPI00278BDF9C|nr:hypothetical protein [Flavobacterium sp. '19STA2R22 D10 B1']